MGGPVNFALSRSNITGAESPLCVVHQNNAYQQQRSGGQATNFAQFVHVENIKIVNNYPSCLFLIKVKAENENIFGAIVGVPRSRENANMNCLLFVQ